jgi:hypothetical protein
MLDFSAGGTLMFVKGFRSETAELFAYLTVIAVIVTLVSLMYRSYNSYQGKWQSADRQTLLLLSDNNSGVLQIKNQYIPLKWAAEKKVLKAQSVMDQNVYYGEKMGHYLLFYEDRYLIAILRRLK